MNKKTVGLFVGATLAGFGIQGCFQTAPPPQCQVLTAPYFATLKKVSNNTCMPGNNLKSMSFGLQEFLPPVSGAATLGLRPERLAANAQPFMENLDPSDDCAAPDMALKCEYCAATTEEKDGMGNVTGYKVILVNDAGVTRDGGAALPNGKPIDVENFCEPIPEEYRREDPSDPEFKKVTSVAKIPRAPANGTCAATDFTPQEQNYAPFSEPDLVKGGNFTLPASSQKYEWSDFKLIVTAEVPGTAFTARMKLTEDGCTTEYDVRGIEPSIACETDLDCDPEPNIDAGRPTGSSLNPLFKPKCNVELGHCLPTVDVTNPKYPAFDPFQ
jgi:hypothetical protein